MFLELISLSFNCCLEKLKWVVSVIVLKETFTVEYIYISLWMSIINNFIIDLILLDLVTSLLSVTVWLVSIALDSSRIDAIFEEKFYLLSFGTKIPCSKELLISFIDVLYSDDEVSLFISFFE